MAPLILYHGPVSPFSRSVLLLTRYLKLDVEVKIVNLQEKEQFSEEYLKMNPQHCVSKTIFSSNLPRNSQKQEVLNLGFWHLKASQSIEFLWHCYQVPTIDDNGFYLWESRAILSYLMESKAPHLVPTSPKEKAIVNQRLHFELGGFTSKFTSLIVRAFLRRSNTPTNKHLF